MSQKDLTQFLEAVRKDPSLQEKLRAEGADPVAIAGEAGFSLTPEEARQALTPPSTTSLSDSDLERVAGGNLGGHSGKDMNPNLSAICGDVNTVQVCVP